MTSRNDEPSPLPPWRLLASEEVQRCRIFSVERRRLREDPVEGESEQKEGDFFVIRSGDWVNVVALTADEEVVMIEQWRHGVERTTLEIPGGMVDANEPPLVAAQRELQEETGYRSDRWLPIGQVDPNPAIQSNTCHTFLALSAERVAAPTFDGHERCRLRLVPSSDVGRLITTGTIRHALVVAGLSFAALAPTARAAGFPGLSAR